MAHVKQINGFEYLGLKSTGALSELYASMKIDYLPASNLSGVEISTEKSLQNLQLDTSLPNIRPAVSFRVSPNDSIPNWMIVLCVILAVVLIWVGTKLILDYIDGRRERKYNDLVNKNK
jgi:hypothetical protein